MDNVYNQTFKVKREDCISTLDSSLPDLLGTYTLVKWMEIVSAKNINQHLDEKHISVGEKVSIEHSGMVKNNASVQIMSVIQAQNNRNVSFIVEAKSDNKVVAKAEHHRVIVPKKLIDRLFRK